MRVSALALVLALAAAAGTAGAEAARQAPTRLYAEPAVYLLLRLPGDTVTVRYTPGSLDRAANLQHRLELAMRAFKRRTDARLELNVYLLNRDEWRQARYDVPYGIPVRVGHRALAAPAEGDDGTVALWNELLEGVLPTVGGVPLRGTPQQAATMVLADFLTQLQAAEILVDELEIGGGETWVRGLVSHLTSLVLVRQFDETRLQDLDTMYRLLAANAGPGARSARDYRPDLDLREWFWYQAQFHRGARLILDKEGKGALKKMKKLRKRSGGVLSSELLLRRYKGLDEWYRTSFSSVSMRRGP